MDKFIDKLSSYNLLNNMLPGAVFCYLLSFINIHIVNDTIIDKIFAYYFIGMIISRIGSIIVEPICKICKIVKFAEYDAFLIAIQRDPKIDIFSETNNTYRTMLATCLLFLSTKIYFNIEPSFADERVLSWIPSSKNYIVIMVLIILFACAYRKQTEYIKKRVDKIKKENDMF